MMKKSVKNDKKTKFNVGKEQKDVEKRTFNGIIFASEMEKKYYCDVLLPQEQSGLIRSIIVQPEYLLVPKFTKHGKNYLPIRYVADFEVTWSDGKIITYDVKGFLTEACKIKLKLYQYTHPEGILELITLSPKYGGWMDYYDLQRLRSKSKKEKEKNGRQDESL
jgi:hypothetical protein